jgi:imidazolonepropionase
MAVGLDARLHAGQLGPSAGIRLAVELGAASVDHCTYATDDDVEALAGAADTTVATLLPGAEFSTRARYPDGRRLVDAGATVALATDCNPGSSFTTSMPFCIAVAVRDMNFTPAQGRRHCAATTSGSSPSGGGRISFGWTPRRTCTSRTGPVCRWFVMS